MGSHDAVGKGPHQTTSGSETRPLTRVSTVAAVTAPILQQASAWPVGRISVGALLQSGTRPQW